jgi:hypothetical protein
VPNLQPTVPPPPSSGILVERSDSFKRSSSRSSVHHSEAVPPPGGMSREFLWAWVQVECAYSRSQPISSRCPVTWPGHSCFCLIPKILAQGHSAPAYGALCQKINVTLGGLATQNTTPCLTIPIHHRSAQYASSYSGIYVLAFRHTTSISLEKLYGLL